MSDAEDHIEPSSEIPRGGSSSSQQDSVSALPLTSSIEQPPESADLASTFSLFKDYFDKKLNALKRDIQAQADQAMALLMICKGRSRFDSNDRIMPHKSLNSRSFVPKLQ